MLFLSSNSFQTKAIFNKISSAQWKSKFNDIGSFEFHIDKNSKDLDTIKVFDYVTFKNHYGIILYKNYSSDNDVKITGCDMNQILKWRYCYGNKSGTLETIIKNYVEENFVVKSAGTVRGIEKFLIAVNQERGRQVDWNNEKLATVYDTVKELCSLDSLGFQISIDDEYNYVFDVLSGTDKSNDILFSKEGKNLSDINYEENSTNDFNTVCYIEETKTEDSSGNNYITHTIQEYKTIDKSGIERREIIGENNLTVEKSQSILVQNSTKKEIESTINPKLVYNRDYGLGDIVSVRINSFGENAIIKKKIVEMKEVWEKGNIKTEPTFASVN